MTEVVWSDLAKKNLRKTVDYLFENWTVKEVNNLLQNIAKLLENVRKNNLFCPKSRILNLRKCFVDKNNSLIYLLENHVIYIVTIIHNKSANPY